MFGVRKLQTVQVSRKERTEKLGNQMTATLDDLELSAEQLNCCQEEVQKLAYRKWQEAGCPIGEALNFWLAAEREWIGRCYVPSRECDGSRLENASSCEQPIARRVPEPRRRASEAVAKRR